MNERIRELAGQAEEYALRECNNNGHFHQIYREKFAESIVNECLLTLEFHNFDDAIPCVEWMAKNKLGVLNEKTNPCGGK
jgi:hypothetical protein